MLPTRSDAWEQAGLDVPSDAGTLRHARRQAAVYLPLLIGVLVLYYHRVEILGKRTEQQWHAWIQWGTVVALLAIGWALGSAIGQAVGPMVARRMDPSTAGTVGFVIRLFTLAITVILALDVAGVSATGLIAGSAFTAVVFGLAAQQTLGNLFAGLVLLTARPFSVGERIRLQAGPLGGTLEGVVSSLGLMYTTLARGADRIMIPNNGVLSAVIMPVRVPSSVDVRVRLSRGVAPSQVQAILDSDLGTPTRAPAAVLLEEIDGDDIVVRVRATPERGEDATRLEDEIIATLAGVTSEHEIVSS